MTEIFRCTFGSHLYGTALPGSDLDFKAVRIPDAREILLGRARASLNGKAGNLDVEVHTLQRFIELALEGQTAALEMLFVPDWGIQVVGPVWNAVLENRRRLLHRNLSAFVGYCRTQAGKYCVRADRLASLQAVIGILTQLPGTCRLADDLPVDLSGIEHVTTRQHAGADGRQETFLVVLDREYNLTATVGYVLVQLRRLEDSYGVRARAAVDGAGADWKALMHAVRVAGEAEEVLLTGHITFPRPDASALLSIRQGRLSVQAVQALIGNGLERVESALSRSSLPDEPDRPFWDDFVVETYRAAVCV